jgi:hypothetical protein
MTRRAAAAVALLGCGLLLLATTQPWVVTVTEVAPGAPRSRDELGAAELVPWLAPVALVTGLAVVGALSGLRWAGALAAVASLAVLGGTVLAAAVVVTASGPLAAARTVAAAPTAWLWVGGAGALAMSLGTLLGWHGPRRERSGARSPARQDPHGVEARRRRDAAQWQDLSEGRDPTAPGPDDQA